MFTVVLVALAAALAVAGCRRTESAGSAPAAPEGWDLRGRVVAVNADRGTLTVAHEEIPGFMPAMTMEFKVSAGDLATAKAGQRIRAWLYRSQGEFHLERIWPDDDASRRTVEAATAALKQDTAIRGAHPYREVGEAAPDFALYDQDGEVVQANRFRGKRIVLNFIFTRCPDPKMCPAATERMAKLQREAKARGIERLELVSISLDPAYDTPGVLREYADARGIDTSNFSFLTGPQEAVTHLMAQLGVIAFVRDGVLTHSMATLLIDADGRIVHREDGSLWDIEQFLSRLAR